MGHSDEWTFADYFRYEKEIYRAIISAAVLCQWIAEHDTPPTDGEAEELANHTQRAVSFICECMDRQSAGAVSFITAASEKAIPSLLGMYGWFCTFRGNQLARSNPRGKRRIRNTAYSRK